MVCCERTLYHVLMERVHFFSGLIKLIALQVVSAITLKYPSLEKVAGDEDTSICLKREKKLSKILAQTKGNF